MATDLVIHEPPGLFEERVRVALTRARVFGTELVRNRLALAGLVIIVVLVAISLAAPLLVGPYPAFIGLGPRLLPPSLWDHPLGTDGNGFDVLTLVVYGGRVSLLIGFVSSGVAMLLGTTVGLLAGYYGRFTDQILARAIDFFLVIPWLPFAIILVAVLGASLSTIILAIAIVSWPTTARVIRSQVLTLKERMFIERAKAVGASGRYVVWRHILPNVMPLVWAEAVLTISSAVFTEAFLAFFGFAARDPGSIFSWGTIVNDAYAGSAAIGGKWWWLIPPGLLITVTVLGFAMLGYGLEEVMNPPLKRR